MGSINFDGQAVVVTGAGGGLGRAYCLELARRGASVVVNDLGGDTTGAGGSSEFADRIVEEIIAGGGKAVANYDNVASEAGGEGIVGSALSAFGRIDAVISNAGNQRNKPFGEFTADDIEAVLAVHLKGAFFVCQPAYREMVRQGYGRLVLVGSQSGIFGNPMRSNYGAAKTAMIGLMNVIAQEAPDGVLVNCVFPNAAGGRLGGTPSASRVDADFMAAASERGRQYFEGLDPSFVAPMTCFLASSACTTSQNMFSVLGGKYSRIFVGLSRGWFKPGAVAPTMEEIRDKLPQINDLENYAMPLSGLEEMDQTVQAKNASLPA